MKRESLIALVLWFGLMFLVAAQLFGMLRLSTTPVTVEQLFDALQTLAILGIVQTALVLALFGVLVYDMGLD
ncbi:MAG: hypothetical protein ACFFFC_19470 [Candidatus Thorarchaeota archaeon]